MTQTTDALAARTRALLWHSGGAKPLGLTRTTQLLPIASPSGPGKAQRARSRRSAVPLGPSRALQAGGIATASEP